MKSYQVIGMMSGTSLDGLDLACVQLTKTDHWKVEILKCKTIAYSKDLSSKLSESMKLDGFDLRILDVEYGRWLGKQCRKFMVDNNLKPDLIVSHGHTVFHQPSKGLTVQIGSGYEIATATATKTVYDLRSMDVALGGQGAPLVPIGDKMLFGEYDFCLNLGGFSNISFQEDGQRLAFDICPVNTVLNHLSSKLGFEYDECGKLARSGKLIPALLKQLNGLPYYAVKPPKSLGIEWVNAYILPLLKENQIEDQLHTFCQHVAAQVISTCANYNKKGEISTLLVTGGGAKNLFLIELMQEKAEGQLDIIIPEKEIIDFKEAIIFAFLGLLRALNKINTLSSVTGATKNSSGGIIIDI